MVGPVNIAGSAGTPPINLRHQTYSFCTFRVVEHNAHKRVHNLPCTLSDNSFTKTHHSDVYDAIDPRKGMKGIAKGRSVIVTGPPSFLFQELTM